MKNKYMRRRLIFCLLVLILLFFIVFLICSNKKNNSNRQENLKAMNYTYESRVDKLNEFDSNDFQKYGWLQVQGTSIDLPVLSPWAIDNVDYSFGWLVSTSFNYDTRKIIAGHNVLNVSKTPMVNNPDLSNFEPLMAFVYYDFAKENMYLVYTEDGQDKVYVIYAAGFYDYEYEYDKYGLDKDEVNDYLKFVKKNSIYDYGVDVNKDDDIITIKTCTRMFGTEEKQQFQIDARLLRKDEKMVKYNIKKTKLYKEYKLNDKYTNDFS